MVTEQDMNDYGFKCRGEITINDDNKAIGVNDLDDIIGPCVYAWLTVVNGSDNGYNTRYVGKAGYGLRHRMNQHFRGLAKSLEKNVKRALEIEKLLRDDGPIYVFARESITIKTLGDDLLLCGKFDGNVSLYDAEEAAAHQVLQSNRMINKQGFPRVPAGDTPSDESETTIQILNARLAGLSNYDIYLKFIGKFDSDNNLKETFINLVRKIQNTDIWRMDIKISRGYSPLPYNSNKPHLVFCKVNNGRSVQNTKLALISLTDVIKITFIEPIGNNNTYSMVKFDQENCIYKNTGDNFSPKNTEDFIGNYGNYVCDNKIKEFVDRLF